MFCSHFWVCLVYLMEWAICMYGCRMEHSNGNVFVLGISPFQWWLLDVKGTAHSSAIHSYQTHRLLCPVVIGICLECIKAKELEIIGCFMSCTYINVDSIHTFRYIWIFFPTQSMEDYVPSGIFRNRRFRRTFKASRTTLPTGWRYAV